MLFDFVFKILSVFFFGIKCGVVVKVVEVVVDIVNVVIVVEYFKIILFKLMMNIVIFKMIG